MVWPALLPPWNLTTTSARAASQSISRPLPSSPHWAPITVTLPKLPRLQRTRARKGDSNLRGRPFRHRLACRRGVGEAETASEYPPSLHGQGGSFTASSRQRLAIAAA